MIRDAVILAAGKGSRIRTSEGDLPKPLHQVGGVPLIRRTALTLAAAGIERIVVVLGFMGDVLRESIENDPAYARAGLTMVLVENSEFELANGVSVIAGARKVSGPFLLSMADHVYDTELPRRLVNVDMDKGDLHLCVDRRVSEVYDIDDATKVASIDGRIVEIGKTIPTYDCIDCGVFAVSQQLVSLLQQVREVRGDCSLSGGVQQLAQLGRARVVDIGTAFWQDVDTPDARLRAEQILAFRAAAAVSSAAVANVAGAGVAEATALGPVR